MRYALVLSVALLAATPTSVISQIELKRGIDPDLQTWWLLVQGLPGEHRVRFIASRNVADQLRRDAIRELDVEVPAGALRNALARAGRSGGRLGTVRVRQSAEDLDGWIYLHSVSCVTCAAAAGDPDKLGRVKLRFPSATVQAAALAAPMPGIEGSPVGTADVGAQVDIATKTQPMDSQISCPVSELKYGFAQSFPDPWYGTETVESEPVLVGAAFTNGPFSATVAGNPMLVCRWKGYGNTAALFVARPMVNMPVASYPCPPQLQVKVLTSLPAPWVGTTYSWSLTTKGTSETLPQYSSTLPNSNFCVYSGTAPLEILYPLQVTAEQGMTGLAAVPPPKIDQLAQNFLVTKAQLTATPATGSASCPTTVRFDARIATNGPGNVQYRRQINGQAGSLQTVNFTAAGEKIVSFETQVAPPEQGSGPALTTQAQASNVVNGQARMIIQSPGGVSASNVASYRISCTTVSPTGNLQAAVPPGAAPARTAPTRVASGVRPRTVMRGGRIPVRVADGRTGWVLFNLSGQPGGPASGSITLLLAAPRSPAVTTEYQVSAGTFSQNQSDYEFIMQGTARKSGGSSRHFSSRLKLVGSARSGEQTMVADDVWVIDGLTCQKSGNELICT